MDRPIRGTERVAASQSPRPDGQDDWTFDLHMTTRFSDGTSRNFTWRGVRLDNANPERILALAPAEVR